MNPLAQLHAYGQSFWYDNIRRDYLQDGTLQGMIDDDGLRGMTSNPSIFAKSIGGSNLYDEQLHELAASGAETMALYEALAIADIQAACDLFAPLYATSNGGDGYVSLEVSPYLAHDSAGTVAEARRLWATVNRPNLMIKVPATPEGIPAVRQLLSEGINVNITLMFSMAHYEAVANAYIEGVRALAANGGEVSRIASVASFFVSRVDTAVDKQLENSDDGAARELLGKTAVANSKVVYQRFLELFHGPAFADLAALGAPVQRLLWASTSAKNPAYSPTLYIDELIGPQTVSTIPPETVDAFRENGRLANTLQHDIPAAQSVLRQLAELGISLEQITDQLQVDGVAAFAKAFDDLLAAIEAKRTAA
jgi:transaldolase